MDFIGCTTLVSLKINSNIRLPKPYISEFHSDINMIVREDLLSKFTTSIFYVNTCNGYTELKDGTKIESVANRLVSFPADTRHRSVSQTDEQRRLVININYLSL